MQKTGTGLFFKPRRLSYLKAQEKSIKLSDFKLKFSLKNFNKLIIKFQ